MSRLTINQIMTQIAATVNQDATAPTSTSSEFALWLQYINRGIFEWANSHDWEVLRQRFYPAVTGVTQATVSLPADFRKLARYPVIYDGAQTEGTEFPMVLPEETHLYNSTDKYFTITGDISSGFALVFHPGTLASGVSLQIEYFATPTSLASPAQIPLVTDSQFLVDRTIAYILESRSDARFQLQEVKARDRLLQMIESADLAKYNSYAGPSHVRTPEERMNFRVGRD